VRAGFFLFVLLFAPDALAWGLQTHVFLAQWLLAAAPFADPQIRAAALRLPRLILAGACLPDLALAGRMIGLTTFRRAHQWSTLRRLSDARSDEERARAKERIFSHRDEFGQWDPKNQRPELWDLYNARVHKGEHVRVFPISNWTELDVWQYIAREELDVPSIYYAHRRPVVRRTGLLVPVTDLTPPRAGEAVEEISVRFRTVGDVSCTCPVESVAATPEEIILETVATRITERGATRMDDQTSDASMERRKREGYF